MFLNFRYLILKFACSLIITCNLSSSDLIPVMLWRIKGDRPQIKSTSALGNNNEILSENIKENLQRGAKFLVFVMNKLSLEDFYLFDEPMAQNNTLYHMQSFLDAEPHMLLTNVKDPLNSFHGVHCGVQEIAVENNIESSVIVADALMKQACILILHISDSIGVPEKGRSVFLPTFVNPDKNIIGVFTGVKSSWGAPDSDHHIMRNLLATSVQENNFVNFTGCIIMYAESAFIKVGKEGNNSVTLPFPVDTDGSSCDSNSTVLQLNFKPTGPLSSVIIKLTFQKKRNAWKTAGTVSMSGDKAIAGEKDLVTETIEAPIGFSYSCGNLIIKAKNDSSVTIVMNGFQIQPFEVKKVFSDSFDCVPYFTIPIWMGVFVSILFIVILNIGIYALFSVHTMDRFDDPKGKTISVATAAGND